MSRMLSIALASLTATAALAGCAAAPASKGPARPTAVASAGPQGAFVQLLHTIDRRRWSDVRARMADRVYTDYASLFSVAPGEQKADALVGAWKRLLSPLDATQHLLGEARVRISADGTRAQLTAAVRGYHVAHGLKGGDRWMVAGQYEALLLRGDKGWRLRRLALLTHDQRGNLALLRRLRKINATFASEVGACSSTLRGTHRA